MGNGIDLAGGRRTYMLPQKGPPSEFVARFKVWPLAARDPLALPLTRLLSFVSVPLPSTQTNNLAQFVMH